MDADALRWAIGQGGLAIAFVVLFHFYRKDVKSYTELWRGVSDNLIIVVKENTTSNVKMLVLLEALHRRFDKDDTALPRSERKEK
jgi:hypothetical protein